MDIFMQRITQFQDKWIKLIVRLDYKVDDQHRITAKEYLTGGIVGDTLAEVIIVDEGDFAASLSEGLVEIIEELHRKKKVKLDNRVETLKGLGFKAV